jgi:TonB-linked SusC/RagA family outer membrane protein
MTLDQNIGEKVKVGGSLTYTSGKITGVNPTGTGNNSLFYHAYTYRPIPIPGIQVEDFEESLYDPSNGINDYRVNPVLSARNEIRNNISNNTIGNLYLDYRILKNLKLTIRGALNTNAVRVEAFNGSGTRSGGPNGTAQINGSVSDSKSQVYDNTNLLEYKATINGKHRINTLLGTAIQKVDYSIYGYSATNIPDESLGLSGLDAGIINSLPTGRRSSNSLVSGFGSVNYIFNNKYYFTATFRADGSSKFVGNNRWGYFPSAAVKWKLSEEKFFKKLSVLSDGNISFSYGETGNNRVGDFDTYATIQFQNPLSLNGALQGNSAVITSLANPSLRWETTRSADLGFDFGFFDNRLTLALGLYHKQTDDLLYQTSLPTSTGYTSSIKNIASISNRGLEIALDVKVINKRDFDYTTNFNISFNRNRLEALADPSEEAITSTVNWEFAYSSIPAYISKIGGPLGQIYGLVSDGLYQYGDFDRLPNGSFTLKPNMHSKGAGTTAERAATQPGDVKFVDINNDGQITAEDRTVLGNGYPLHIGGWSNNLRYKNFDLNIFFQWSYGNDIINANRLWFDQGLGIKERGSIFSGQNSFAAFADRWTPENQNTDIPRLNRAITGVYGSQFVEDGSYLRLKTLNLGYTLPSKWLKKYKVSRLRVYVSTNNIITWSRYKGYDPEVSAFRTGLTPSLDYSTYPRPLTITGGLNLTL